jgi:predicted ATPase
MTQTAIRLFGVPAFIEDGTARRIGGPPRTLALLLYLVLHRRLPLERKRVAFALWPDAAEEEATANLRRHLHALAATLPAAPVGAAAWFTTTRVSVTWNAAPSAVYGSVDVVAFEEALAAGDDERAIGHYGGPLCPSVDEPWADRERDRFAQLALGAYERLVERERQRDTQRALSLAAQSLTIDPWHEPTIRALIELRALAGDAAGARREYHEFAARLEREYAAPPDPHTTAVYDRIAPDAPLVQAQSYLPQQLTEVLGRDTEIADMLNLLQGERLVTVVGVGGVGKTRLAVEVGARLTDAFADGVCFAELVSVSDPGLVAGAIASCAGIAPESAIDPIAAIVAGFGERLFIVDNCEHVLEATAAVIEAILRDVPQARVLATSREPLRLTGEVVFRLQPLSTAAAVSLFAARARAVNRRFTLAGASSGTVAEICRRLDGNALAIELAAARMNVLTVDQILRQLDARFRLLVGGKRNVAEHHRALRASLDWSYGLLDARDRRVLARLSVFAASFSLETASALCAQSADALDLDVVESVTSLVDKSLVVADDSAPDLRFSLLESVRLFAREQLEIAGESSATAARHLDSIMRAFETAGARFAATPRDEIVLELLPLLPDARAALNWARAQGPSEIERGARLLCATVLWDRLRLGRECIALAQMFLAVLPAGADVLAARLWRLIAYAYDRDQFTLALEPSLRAVDAARRGGDAEVVADVLTQHAFVSIRFKRLDEARDALAEAAAAAPPTAARRLSQLAGMSYLATLAGKLDDAARFQTAVMETHRFLGNRLGEIRATSNLAEIEHARGDTGRAVTLARAVRVLSANQASLRAINELNLAGYLLALGDAQSAREPTRSALAYFAEYEPGGARETIAVGHAALIAALVGAERHAAHLLGYVDRMYDQLGVFREDNEARVHAKLRAIVAAGLGDADRAAALAEGAAWDQRRAVGEAERFVTAAAAAPSWVPIGARAGRGRG